MNGGDAALAILAVVSVVMIFHLSTLLFGVPAVLAFLIGIMVGRASRHRAGPS